MVKKFRVRRFAPNPVLVLDKFTHGERFFSLFGKNLSTCGKFNDIIAKHKHCLYSGWRIYLRARDFYRGEKSLAVRELVQDKYWARSEAANPLLFKF
jgi:hypothetical protein